MVASDLTERIRVVPWGDSDERVFPVGHDDLELQLKVYDPDFDEFIPSEPLQVLVDAECKGAENEWRGYYDLEKLMHAEGKFLPSSRLLFAALISAYDLMQEGDERAKRFLDKFMKRMVNERVATDGGSYGVIHHDGLGKGIYATKCPPYGNFDEIWQGDVARTMQILTGQKDPDKFIDMCEHYKEDCWSHDEPFSKPVLLTPERIVRAVHIGFDNPLSICFGHYPDGHGGLGRGMSGLGDGLGFIKEK